MKVLKKVSNTVSNVPTQRDSQSKHRDRHSVSMEGGLPKMVLKTLSVAMASALVASITQVAQADIQAKMIGDLEIYKAPAEGQATITMMLDTSGSMSYWSVPNDYTSKVTSISNRGYCYYVSGGSRSVKKNYTVTMPFIDEEGQQDGTVSFQVSGCPLENGSIGYNSATKEVDGYLGRLSRVKVGLIGLLADSTKLPSKHKIGVGNYSANGSGKAGKIGVPAKPLTKGHRLALINYIKNMGATGLTPSANAYAEAGAYMMGTSTQQAASSEEYYTLGWITHEGGRHVLRECTSHLSTTYYESSIDDQLHYCRGNSYSTVVNSGILSDAKNATELLALYNSNTLEATTGVELSNFSDGIESAAIIGDNSRVFFIARKPFANNDPDPYASYSGFPYSVSSSKDGENYDSPISSDNQCGGNGIFFLTDGEPNGSSYDIASSLMNRSLETTNGFSKSSNVPVWEYAYDYWGNLVTVNRRDTDCTGDLVADTLGGAWGCMGEYARKLRATDNPSGVSIKTAAVGFGSAYTNSSGSMPTKPHPTDPDKTIADCDAIEDTSQIHENRHLSAKNLCLLSEETYGYGEGGFTATNAPDVLAKSVTDFLGDLNGDIGSTPTGIIVVPDDPYNASSQQAIAFYPTVDAKAFDANAIWSGNMKKYALNDGTLYGKGDKKLFLDITGALDAKVQDLWSDKDYKVNGASANNAVTSGGFYAHLSSPKDGITSLRTLYLEDWDNPSNKKPVLRKLGVNSGGKVTLDDSPIGGSNRFVDTDTYTDDNIRALLEFLGFSGIDSSLAIKDLTLTVADNAPESIRVLGASMHSNPALVSYSASLDEEDGTVTDERDEYVLFGSMDGALHLADIDDDGSSDGGKEVFAFIPREIIKNQPQALIAGNTHDAIGIPKMGMDAPWLVTADYTYDLDNNQVRVDKSASGINAYGGMRMGGIGFYGLNLNDRTSPELLFTLAPEYDTDGKPTGDFSRMGQIWAKPTKAKIRLTNSDTDTGTDVLIFGGGYDMCYEYEDYQVGLENTADSDGKKKYSFPASCENKTTADGNAVYIVNAGNGELIWSASNKGGTGSKYTKNSKMRNSIVAGITVLDRNNDGYMDHLYFADLGGQVFRADFKNAGFKDADGNIESSFSNQRVIRILKAAHNGKNNKQYRYRFYERPVVSFYRNSITKRLFAMVNIISGDRSSPLSKMRKNNKYADRLYGIMDIDVAKANSILFAEDFDDDGTGRTVYNIGDGQLYELPKDGAGDDGDFSATEKETIITKLKAGKKKGWYYPLIRFDGFNKVKYTKGMGKSEVVGGFLFTSTYNPDMSYGEGASCSAEIVGGSERQLYCLPYGICTDEKSKNGTGGFIRAGKGIQELTLGPRSSEFSNQRLLIGTRSIEERKDNRIDFGEQALEGGLYDEQTKVDDPLITNVGADGTAPLYIFNERYTFNPTTWYESSDND